MIRVALVLFLAGALLSPHLAGKSDSWKDEFPKGAKAEGALVRDESDRPYYADYWQRQLAEHPNPKEAIQLADAYFDSLPFAQRTPHRDKVRVDYLRGFFSGFTDPTGEIVGGEHDAYWFGFQGGQLYRRINQDKLKETMEGFGYTACEAEGTWILGFETSCFRPRDRDKTERWWLSGLDESVFALVRDARMPDGGIPMRVVGYLSPKGQYGHLGSYEREFFATKVFQEEGANKSADPTPSGGTPAATRPRVPPSAASHL